MGGMAAQIPVKNDEAANAKAFAKVRADKEQEVTNGHDGTWVAHPGLVSIAMEVFDKGMPEANQIDRKRAELEITEEALVALPKGSITERGVRENINVGILYVESWLRGHGAAAIYNLMEDAATAEISRTQLWQWRKEGVQLDNGRWFDTELYREYKREEVHKITQLLGKETYDKGRFKEAEVLFDSLVLQDEFQEFLTLGAYQKS